MTCRPRDAGDRQPPGDELGERLHPASVWPTVLNVPGSRPRSTGSVVALRLRAHHGPVDAPGPALEDLPVLVDEEVVADVVPAVGVAVEPADGEHDRGRVRGRVVVGAVGVVHERHLHVAVFGRPLRVALVPRPLRAGDDRRLARGCRARGRPGSAYAPDVRPHEVDVHAACRPRQAQLVAVRAPGPHRPRAAQGGRAIGRVGALVGAHPGAPAPGADAAGAHVDRHLRGRAPLDPEQVERARRPDRRRDHGPCARGMGGPARQRLREIAGTGSRRGPGGKPEHGDGSHNPQKAAHEGCNTDPRPGVAAALRGRRDGAPRSRTRIATVDVQRIPSASGRSCRSGGR